MIKYFEIPVTKFDENGQPETPTSYYAIGEESRVRKEVTEYFENMPEVDFDFIELTEDEYAASVVGNDGMVLFEEDDNDYDVTNIEKAPPAKSIEDEMEDLQDQYYQLTDKLNAIPNLDINKKDVIDAKYKLSEAKEYFDQYDMLKCKKSLGEASELISKITDSSSAKEYVTKSFSIARPNEDKLLSYLENSKTDWKHLAKSLISFLSDKDIAVFMQTNGYEDILDG